LQAALPLFALTQQTLCLLSRREAPRLKFTAAALRAPTLRTLSESPNACYLRLFTAYLIFIDYNLFVLFSQEFLRFWGKKTFKSLEILNIYVIMVGVNI